MKLTKKLLSTVTAAALCMSLTSTFAGSFVNVSAANTTAIDMVEDMGLGWNLGNSLSGSNTWDSGTLTPEQIETAWGNPLTTEAMIKEIKKAGFKTVRIPVTWYQALDGKVDMDAYLARVQTVVDYCLDNGLYCIINTHNEASWLNASAQSKFTDLWKKIATYFKDYDEKLVFEDMNEIEITNAQIMTLNQAFVDTVRATGGNNAKRLLLVPASNNNTDKCLSSDFSAPKDSANMVAVSVHYYEPTTFCVAETDSTWGYTSTWGTNADYTLLEANLDKLEDKFIDKGIPVIIGEYGVVTDEGKDDASIKKFLKEVASYSYGKTGMCAVLWDDSNAGTMKYFDRNSLSWYDDEIKQIFADVISGGTVEPGTKTDRISLTADEMTAEEKGYSIDMKPYGEMGLTASSVVVEYELISTKNSKQVSGDVALSFNFTESGNDDEKTRHCWTFIDNAVGIDKTLTSFEIPVGENTFPTGDKDKDGNAITKTGTFEMDYLKVENWWTWSGVDDDEPVLNIKNVTVIFDNFFYPDQPIETTTTTTTTTAESTTTTTTTTTTTVEPVGVKGDVNDDGEVTIADVVRLCRYVAQDDTLAPAMTAAQVANADVNGDAIVDSSDITVLARFLAHLVETV